MSGINKIARGLKQLKVEAEEKTKMAVKPHSTSDLNKIMAGMPSFEKTVMANQPMTLSHEYGSVALIGEEKFILSEIVADTLKEGRTVAILISLDDVKKCLEDISYDFNHLPRYKVTTHFLCTYFEGASELLDKIHDANESNQIEIDKQRRALEEEAKAQTAKVFDEDPLYGSW